MTECSLDRQMEPLLCWFYEMWKVYVKIRRKVCVCCPFFCWVINDDGVASCQKWFPGPIPVTDLSAMHILSYQPSWHSAPVNTLQSPHILTNFLESSFSPHTTVINSNVLFWFGGFYWVYGGKKTHHTLFCWIWCMFHMFIYCFQNVIPGSLLLS